MYDTFHIPETFIQATESKQRTNNSRTALAALNGQRYIIYIYIPHCLQTHKSAATSKEMMKIKHKNRHCFLPGITSNQHNKFIRL